MNRAQEEHHDGVPDASGQSEQPGDDQTQRRDQSPDARKAEADGHRDDGRRDTDRPHSTPSHALLPTNSEDAERRRLNTAHAFFLSGLMSNTTKILGWSNHAEDETGATIMLWSAPTDGNGVWLTAARVDDLFGNYLFCN